MFRDHKWTVWLEQRPEEKGRKRGSQRNAQGRRARITVRDFDFLLCVRWEASRALSAEKHCGGV